MPKITGKRFKPECVVSFSTEEGDLVARSKPKEQGDAIDGDVISVNTTNDLAQDTGTFQIMLTNRNKWNKKLASNDLVSILMRRNGESDKKATVFVGLIDDVRKTTIVQDNNVQRAVSVTGRSFFKSILNFEVGSVPEVEEITTSSLGWLSGRITFAGSSSSEIIKQLMEQLVFKYMNYKFENGKTLKGMLKLKLSNRAGEQLVDETSFINFQGNIHSFIKEVVDEPFNQFFCEVYDGDPTMVERATPFNPDDWNKLPMHKITDKDVVNENLGRSDIETFTLFSVGAKNYFSGFDIYKTTGVRPLWFKPYFEKHGIKRLNRYTGYVGYGAEGDSTQTGEKLKQYQQDLLNWNVMNNNFYNGSIIVTGQSHYKIGDRLLFESEENEETYELFIEGVSHNFINFNSWTTTLQVTRGLPDSGKSRFKYPWGAGTEYESGALGTPVVTSGGSMSTIGNPFLSPEYIFTGGTIGFGTAAKVLQVAQSWLTKPNKYVFGGGRSSSDVARGRFDCSSFVYHCFSQAGMPLGNMTSVTTDTLAKLGTRVFGTQNLQPGDLVFFNTYKFNGHVTIYMGDGKAIGSQSSTGVGIISVSDWAKRYGLGYMVRVL